ncbi:MAG: arylsulfatase, partial [Planctomycetes bacterium]|nr:arylsulfatase [Planctomycetota bacterium]
MTRFGYRRLFLLLVAFAGMAAGGAGNIRPNVILIMTDDQGFGDMSCHGNPYIKTPAIDKLHSEAVRFTDFHVDPMCTPTRAALMTGRYSTRTGAWLTYASRNHLRRDEVTMADVFKAGGYKTAIFGKWHLGDSYPFRPMDRGFDESLIHGGGVIGEAPDHWGNDYYDDTYLRNGEPEAVKGYCTDVWFDEAIGFITDNRRRPFFIYLPTNAPHGPRHVPAEYVEPYRDNPDIPEDRAVFYGMIANIDENIARLRGRLEALDLADNTIVIFLTDNGGTAGSRQSPKLLPGKKNYTLSGFNAGMRGNKTSPYEGGHRAACFIHWPRAGFDTSRDIAILSSHFDLLPTLIDLCGLKTPQNAAFDGMSLAVLFSKTSITWLDRTLFVHNQGRKGAVEVYEGLPVKYKDYCVMTGQWRMVGNELYDHGRDPGQTRDVAGENPDVVNRLSKAYEKWWADVTERSEEYTPFVVNPAKQQTVTLTCQSWHGDAIPYNQHHVRSALKSNGYWVIDVEEPGDYKVELRRWPRELDLPVRSICDNNLPNTDDYDHLSKLVQLPSRAINAKTARLKVGAFDTSKSIA